MRIKINPIMAGLLTALPLFSPLVIAAERGQIIIDDPSGQTHMVLDPGDSVTYAGSEIPAVKVVGAGNTLQADGFSVNVTRTDLAGLNPAQGLGVFANDGAVITLSNGSIATGSYMALLARLGSAITANNVMISADGGVEAVSAQLGGSVTLTDVTIKHTGASAGGILASDDGSSITAIDTRIDLRATDGQGVTIHNGGSITLDNTHVTGVGGSGAMVSLHYAPSGANTLILRNGSSFDLDAPQGALYFHTGVHTVQISDSSVTAARPWAPGQDDGLLLYTTTASDPQVTVDATHSVLTGDVWTESGQVDIALKGGTVLTGATIQRGTGTIDRLAVDPTSTWNVRNDSALGTLDNAGTVAFVAPSGNRGFKTLTVNNYAGGGTLVLNTQLGDDTSGTDRLVIDGGTTSGNTSLRILNAGGSGDHTQTGIRVVQTVNGGTTTADAFHLDAGSTGYRASADTLALNGYEYSLARGGQNRVAADWYLTSDAPAVTPPPAPVDPVSPTTPVSPGEVDPNGDSGAISPSVITRPGLGVRNVSPESGAYSVAFRRDIANP